MEEYAAIRPKSCTQLAGGRVCCWILQVSGAAWAAATSAGVPRLVNIVSFLWAVIGGSAGFVLGIRPDLALVAAAALLALDTLVPSALGAKAQPNKRLQPSAPGVTMSRCG